MSSKSTTSLLLLTLSICCILPVGPFAQVLNGGINYRADVRQEPVSLHLTGPTRTTKPFLNPILMRMGLPLTLR